MTSEQMPIERTVDSSAYITANAAEHVKAGQSISSATWSPDDTDLTTLVVDTAAVDNTLKQISAKFNYLAAGVSRITVTITLTNPAESHVVWILVRQVDAPEV